MRNTFTSAVKLVLALSLLLALYAGAPTAHAQAAASGVQRADLETTNTQGKGH